MASLSVTTAGLARTGNLLLACVAEHGTAGHPYLHHVSLTAGAEASRNLADTIHFLCALHGRAPGIVDLAATRTIEPAARRWLDGAAEALAAERAYLARLSVAAGQMPSTPGSQSSEAAIIAQRGALATLASSDRHGCALGAALAFAADWSHVRTVLDLAAKRLGIDVPPCRLGAGDVLGAVADAACASERAILFGGQQLALQHRALWDLLEARQQARRDS